MCGTAQTALRFYYEFGPVADRPAVAAAVEKLLDRPGTAAAAITDLARWQRWSALERISSLYDRQGIADPVTQRAVVGYLTACPLTEAAAALDKLRSSIRTACRRRRKRWKRWAEKIERASLLVGFLQPQPL